jgi:hypothetical protein
MAYGMDPNTQYECPRCGALIQAQGPASLNFQVTNHRWMHEREDKAALRASQGWTGIAGTRTEETRHWSTVPQDDAFYDGARLSKQDVFMLHALGVCWNPKRDLLKA